MLVLTRERLTELLLQVPDLVSARAARDATYPDRVADWLADAEETLAQLRLPLASLIAARRASILSVEDGLLPPEVEASGRSRRKPQRAAATLALADAEAAIRGHVERVDARIAEARQKVAQLVAVASTEEPIALPDNGAGPAELDGLWDDLVVNDETRRMHRYVATLVTASDRRHLLAEILESVANGG